MTIGGRTCCIAAAALLAAALLAMPQAARADEATGLRVYVALGLGADWSEFESGGFNTAGPFTNVGDGDGAAFAANAVIGLDEVVAFGPVELRAELEFMHSGKRSFSTNSFPGTIPSTFDYAATWQTNAILLNLWVDYEPFAETPVILSLGGGAGIAFTETSVFDGVVTGIASDTQFAFAAGAQVSYEFENHATIGVMARYIDFGESDTPLRTIALGTPAGNYTLDHSGWQVMLVGRLDLFNL